MKNSPHYYIWYNYFEAFEWSWLFWWYCQIQSEFGLECNIKVIYDIQGLCNFQRSCGCCRLWAVPNLAEKWIVAALFVCKQRVFVTPLSRHSVDSTAHVCFLSAAMDLACHCKWWAALVQMIGQMGGSEVKWWAKGRSFPQNTLWQSRL